MPRKERQPDNPVLAELDALSRKLALANAALAQRCGCLFTQGGFHKATCDYHQRIFRRLAEAEYAAQTK